MGLKQQLGTRFLNATPGLISAVLFQHAEDASMLYSIRSNLIKAAHVKLHRILRFDLRLAAHLDGLRIAGAPAEALLSSILATPTASTIFAPTITAIKGKATERLNRLCAIAEALPDSRPGLRSAFGWTEHSDLRGLVAPLLTSSSPFLRVLGLSACAMHRVHPGNVRDSAIESTNTILRARSLRAAGELGRVELISSCLSMLGADEEDSRFWGAWSAVLLGNRGPALQALMAIGEKAGQFRARALRLSIQAMNSSDSRQWLRNLARNPSDLRYLIQGSGIAGDPSYVPWLIGHMSEKKTARIAGEAFSLITGLDLAYLDLDCKPPEDTGAGPNDDPDDPNVEMDEDDGLPWPDPDRISKWWHTNGGQFSPGTRYFLGGPLNRENCLRVLKEGFQRQRILAAHYLCLLEPGTTLFEWRAPAFRQQRLLAAMV